MLAPTATLRRTMSKESGYSISDMIDEAWLDSMGKYTIDFGGSNFSRVADLAARDFGEKHPDFKGFVPFIAGAIFQKLRETKRAILTNRSINEGN